MKFLLSVKISSNQFAHLRGVVDDNLNNLGEAIQLARQHFNEQEIQSRIYITDEPENIREPGPCEGIELVTYPKRKRTHITFHLCDPIEYTKAQILDALESAGL